MLRPSYSCVRCCMNCSTVAGGFSDEVIGWREVDGPDARGLRTRPGASLNTCMKGEFNHVCGTGRAARPLPRARSSAACDRRRRSKRLSNASAGA
ncbi:hypothetical protein BVIET440_180120 [Burkholderia vietnamiensis]